MTPVAADFFSTPERREQLQCALNPTLLIVAVLVFLFVHLLPGRKQALLLWRWCARS